VNVELIEKMGNDRSVVNAARVSFANIASNYTDEKNARLIYYLARHGHWSPFSHVFLSFRIKAPIFVARQLAKHQVGLSWNEVSRRYVSVEPEVWIPDAFRKSADNVKQGSSEEFVENDRVAQDYRYAIGLAIRTYNALLSEGVCAEMARAVLPQGMMTEWVWSGSLYAFHRVVEQRTTEYAQRETKEIATSISYICQEYFPISWAALHMT
jgi:thymidylate synthase (FAD)